MDHPASVQTTASTWRGVRQGSFDGQDWGRICTVQISGGWMVSLAAPRPSVPSSRSCCMGQCWCPCTSPYRNALMPDLSVIASILVVHWLVTMSPGANTVLVAQTAVASGRVNALAVIAGICASGAICVGACHHRGLCSQTALISARIS